VPDARPDVDQVVLLVVSADTDLTTLVNPESVATCQSDEAWVKPDEPEKADAVKLGLVATPVAPLAGALIVGAETAPIVVKLMVAE